MLEVYIYVFYVKVLINRVNELEIFCILCLNENDKQLCGYIFLFYLLLICLFNKKDKTCLWFCFLRTQNICSIAVIYTSTQVL